MTSLLAHILICLCIKKYLQFAKMSKVCVATGVRYPE